LKYQVAKTMRHFAMTEAWTRKITVGPGALFRHIVEGKLQEYLPIPG